MWNSLGVRGRPPVVRTPIGFKAACQSGPARCSRHADLRRGVHINANPYELGPRPADSQGSGAFRARDRWTARRGTAQHPLVWLLQSTNPDLLPSQKRSSGPAILHGEVLQQPLVGR